MSRVKLNKNQTPQSLNLVVAVNYGKDAHSFTRINSQTTVTLKG